MRVLLVAPIDSHTNKYIANAFTQIGWDVHAWDYRAMVGACGGVLGMNEALLVKACGYDLVLVLKGELVSPEALRSIAAPTALWHFDPRDGKAAWLVERAQAVTRFFTIADGLVDWYGEQGIEASWLLEGCDPQHHRPVTPQGDRVALSFVGTVEGVAGREAWLKGLAARWPLEVWGSFPSESLRGVHRGRAQGDAGFNQVVSRTVINLGRDRNPDIPRSYGARLFRTLAAGGALLTNNTQGIRDDFGDCVLVYDDDAHCAQLVEDALEHPDRLVELAQRGRKRVLESHTFRHRVEELLERMELA